MNVFERVKDPADPNRCQATHADFQCPYKAVEGTKYCPRHGAVHTLLAQDREAHRQYLVAKWQDRIGRHAEHPKIKNLREEIGILRMTLETRLNQCKDDTDLMLATSALVDLIREIGALVKTCHRVEHDLGQMLDKTQALQFVQELIGVISSYIQDPEILQNLSDEMIASLEKLTTKA